MSKLLGRQERVDDVAELLDHLSHFCTGSCGGIPPQNPHYGYQVDINRDERSGLADLLELIDLLNGTGAYESWLGSMVPGNSTACP